MVAMACSTTSWANQVGYITHTTVAMVYRRQPRPRPQAVPLGLGVVINDKSWLPWYTV